MRYSLLLVLAACSTHHEAKEPASGAAPMRESAPRAEDDRSGSKGGREKAGNEAADNECRDSGGITKRVCRSGNWMCVKQYKDAGKKCSDKSDCQGECLTDTGGKMGTAATGQCAADNDPCGCKTLVKNGQISDSICKD